MTKFIAGHVEDGYNNRNLACKSSLHLIQETAYGSYLWSELEVLDRKWLKQ